MESNSQTEQNFHPSKIGSEDQSEYDDNEKKSKSMSKSKSHRKSSKSKEKQPAKKKGKKENKKAGKKQPKKKKEKVSKSKAKSISNPQQYIQTVKQYMQKQNRPYSLIDIFDNLHGKIKKNALQQVLETLSNSQTLICKQFGKTKVYFLNQANFDVNQDQLQTLGSKLSQLRSNLQEQQAHNKIIGDQLKKITAEKTNKQLQDEYDSLQIAIEKLKTRRNKLINEVEEKVEEKLVIKAEKDELQLRKKLKKYKKLKKEIVDIFCEALEKKKEQVAQIIGIDL